LKHSQVIPPALLTSCLLLGAAVAQVSAQSNWPAFRGANAAGVSTTTVPTSWDVGASRNVAWKTAIPGLAHSSPIVWGDRIYVTTAVAASGRSQVKTGDVEKSGIDSATDTNRMGEITMATPAVAGNMLVVRTQSQLVGIRAS